MKGTIVNCLKELMKNKYGKEKWEQSLEDAGIKGDTVFLASSDVPDSAVMKVVQAACKNLNLSVSQLGDAFGDYWVNVYSQKMYRHYYLKHKTAKDFLMDMDNVHKIMTKSMKNAQPPRFTYEWKNDGTLIMHYNSRRSLVDFLAGLAKGVGKYYHENLKVVKLGSARIQVTFP
ncbi:heme NO binding protein [bacterium BMS3Abin05]|nr:heme NO binding protein [bacterium BMS3Abin05]GBE28832.1 heme NO binding protein [bacterium BMS3Bbin03]HDL78193.1 hypothetical protein [Bacteroidota bacterium]HDZ11078.1 hypothetical protein [Bacteroidota bacterium]